MSFYSIHFCRFTIHILYQVLHIYQFNFETKLFGKLEISEPKSFRIVILDLLSTMNNHCNLLDDKQGAFTATTSLLSAFQLFVGGFIMLTFTHAAICFLSKLQMKQIQIIDDS